MQRRIIMIGGLLQFLGGCAAQAMGIMRRGENAGYGARNVGPRELEQVKVVDASNPDREYFGQSGQPAKAYPPSLPVSSRNPGYGGNQYMSDTGHKVPEAILISWREMPAPGAPSYTGTLIGPFKISVRSKVPPEVLAQAQKDRISLNFGFTSGLVPPYMVWQLEERIVTKPIPGQPSVPFKVLAEGKG